MDPNAAHDLLREWVRRALDNPQSSNAYELDAAQAFAELDQWLSNGGFLPRPWDVSVKS